MIQHRLYSEHNLHTWQSIMVMLQSCTSYEASLHDDKRVCSGTLQQRWAAQ